jgi:hypothetical protein
MVKKSILVTLILLLLYGGFMTYFRIKPVGQHQFQDNIVRAQNYMYNDSVKKLDVIVGTSLSAGFRMDMMPKGIYLLTLPGQSVYDGLALIQNSKGRPKYVFIEGNSLLSPERPEFIKYLFNAPNYYRKKYMPFMRDNYQPAGEFYSIVASHAKGATIRFTHYLFNPFVSIFHKGKPVLVDKDEFYEDQKRGRVKVDSALLKSSFERLRYWVDILQKEGTTVCFYTVPNDPSIYNSNISIAIRDYFPVYFPPAQYNYVPPANVYEYHTKDQIHLDSLSWIKFTNYFAQKISTVRK